ncbi:MAG: type II toxin-antitoxin system Phd/YefM family antitoxin [Elusimicrobia bacterium]|nr:type II toxin-antitoxin system Phd/YefM family antitoxin [Elusimicrobiota bacterium]
MDKIVGIVQARSSLPSILKDVATGKRYVITQRSHARAVIISPEELETLEIQADKSLLEDIKAAKDDIRKGRVVSAKNYFSRRKG